LRSSRACRPLRRGQSGPSSASRSWSGCTRETSDTAMYGMAAWLERESYVFEAARESCATALSQSPPMSSVQRKPLRGSKALKADLNNVAPGFSAPRSEVGNVKSSTSERMGGTGIGSGWDGAASNSPRADLPSDCSFSLCQLALFGGCGHGTGVIDTAFAKLPQWRIGSTRTPADATGAPPGRAKSEPANRR
jgi:hypothetical protein